MWPTADVRSYTSDYDIDSDDGARHSTQDLQFSSKKSYFFFRDDLFTKGSQVWRIGNICTDVDEKDMILAS
ncbi:hypothetical protein JTE90_009127 [Oedothorax gibbosus]|uniref:Uncharacterized protein n=1 Tax=Oedothorax gibbosus TaxID=931172 RepID=A0AAV6UFD2_9ARAC|nr:hypothetical protein JTE90_009127 [Oedothorax gibbosus]